MDSWPVPGISDKFNPMAYQVIARKYRPQKFSDVIGQEHVIRTLKNAISTGRIAHAYLFAGPRGTGKTTLARIFSKALNCSGGPNADFDEQDEFCRDIAEGTCLDVIEIDGASNNGVDQIRDLRETVQYSPNSARFKIYIIDEVHMLSTQAFNALLKTLEEPPAHVKFMMATTEPDKILPTILSRCQRFDLTSIPVEKIAAHLGDIARQENINIEEAALQAIARSADGGMRDAESTLDQLISFCGDTIQEQEVLGMFGLAGRDQIIGIADAVLQANATAALTHLDQLVRSGKDLTRLLADLLNHFRNVLVYSISQGNSALLTISESELPHIHRQASSATSHQLSRIIETIADFESRLKQFSSRKIAIELCLVRAIESRQSIDLNHVLEIIRKLQNGEPLDIPVAVIAPTTALSPPVLDNPHKTEAGQAKPAPIEAPKKSQAAPEVVPPVPSAPPATSGPVPSTMAQPEPAAPAPKDEPAPKAKTPTQPTPAEAMDWEKLILSAGTQSAFLRAALEKAHLSRLSERTLVIGMDPAIVSMMALANTPKNVKAIKAALKDQGFSRMDVEFVEEPHPSGTAPELPSLDVPPPANTTRHSGPQTEKRESPEPEPIQPVKMDPEEFKNDPLIREALEIFKGQIVDVRRLDN